MQPLDFARRPRLVRRGRGSLAAVFFAALALGGGLAFGTPANNNCTARHKIDQTTCYDLLDELDVSTCILTNGGEEPMLTCASYCCASYMKELRVRHPFPYPDEAEFVNYDTGWRVKSSYTLSCFDKRDAESIEFEDHVCYADMEIDAFCHPATGHLCWEISTSAGAHWEEDYTMQVAVDELEYCETEAPGRPILIN